MPGPRILDRESALAIAKKLDADIDTSRGKHDRAIVELDGAVVARFGIRRGKRDGHGHIPKQLSVSLREALELARCHLYKADYKMILGEKGLLPDQQQKSSN